MSVYFANERILQDLNSEQILKVATLNFLNIEDELVSRREILIKKIQENDFDILTLQEVVHAEELIHKITTQTQLKYYFAGKTVDARGLESGNITFSKYEIETSYTDVELLEPQGNKQTPEIFGIVINKNGYNILCFNVHNNWGGTIEHERVKNLIKVSQMSDIFYQTFKNPVVLLAGDLNSVPESASLRGLQGLEPLDAVAGYGTYWIDSYNSGWDENERGVLTTSNPSINYWGKKTAELVKKNPALTPNRRIDYILSYGWCYGVAGYPLSLEMWVKDNERITDHVGLFSRIYLP